jgi:hypothetical protein
MRASVRREEIKGTVGEEAREKNDYWRGEKGRGEN